MADLVLKDRDGTQITYTGVEVVSIPNTEGELEHFINLETGGIPSGGTDGQVLKKKTNTDYDVDWEDEVDITGKADKVTGGTADNFASLDADGNLKDSGKKAADFEVADETILKQADVVDDLTTGGTDVPLSAEQGKLIKASGDAHATADNPHNITADTVGLGTAREDIAIVKKDIKDLTTTIQQSNLSGEDKIYTEGYGTLSLPKNATGYCGVELNGNTLSTLVAQSGVAVSGTVTFNSVLNSKYYDQLHKTILTGTGSQMTITNDTATVANIAVFDLTSHGLDTLTVEQCDLMTDLYFSGTQSAMVSRISSVGKNLFNGNLEIGTYSYSTGEKSISSDSVRNVSNIKIEPLQTYKLSVNGEIKAFVCWYYDINGNFISYNTSGTIVAPSNAHFLNFRFLMSTGITTNSLIQLERNTTATPYEPYRKQEQYIKPYPLYRLPNGTCDTIVDGVYTKRVKRYVLKADDITSLRVAGTNIDYVAIPLTKLIGIISQRPEITNSTYVPNYQKEIDASDSSTWDLTTNNLTWGTTTIEFRLHFTKDTYATLAAAKTALAGTVIYYELVPQYYEYDYNIATGLLNANPNGTIYFDNGFADAGIYSDGITILNQDYPIVTLEKLLILNADGSHTDLDVSTATIALDGKSFTHAGLTNGDIIAFTYKGADSPLKGKNKITYLDSKNTIADTANGKFYKYKPVVTNGVIASWTLTEV